MNCIAKATSHKGDEIRLYAINGGDSYAVTARCNGNPYAKEVCTSEYLNEARDLFRYLSR